MAKIMLHLEGLAVFISCFVVYYMMDGNWLLFILLLFVPDISALGFLLGKQTGTIMYNVFHTYIISLPLIVIGLVFDIHVLVIIGLIWTAHIGMDRLFGFGLKYPENFQDTHFNRL